MTPALVAALVACGGRSDPATEVAPRGLPLPTAGFSGAPVSVFPLTLLAASDSLGWDDELGPRDSALARANAMIAATLAERNPEVEWVLPPELRRIADRAPGMLANPDRLATPALRSNSVDRIPDPLSSQMRNLVGVVGGRFALVPASLFFVPGSDPGEGSAELTLVIVDVRTVTVSWRNVAVGTGSDPWQTLRAALRSLNPDIP